MKEEKVVTKISKWGNGYGIRLPIGTLQAYQLSEGSEVVISREDSGVKISPRVPSFADLSLEEIMAGVVPATIRADSAESAFGGPQGNEVW